MKPAIALSTADRSTQRLRQLINSVAATAALLAVPAVLFAAEGSYSYVRSAEGSSRLISSGAAPAGNGGDQLEINQPILNGDRLLAAPRGRVDIELADRNLLRVDGGTDLVFAQLAGSGDRDDRSTLLRLENGEIQLVVVDDSYGDQFPRVDTANASVYLQSAGTFRVTTETPDWTSVVVREGSAEVVTRNGSWTVAAGEELRVEGSDRARGSLVAASGWSALERWGQRLDAEVLAANSRHVDRSLRYATAPLDRHGSWFSTGGRYAWRPSVGLEWRPYTDGRWVYTPSGLTWVSSEPWGWATSHYGGWDYVPSYGWSWFPGRTYAPAWVYWYWANDYVAWCPTAYYTRFYRASHGDRFRWGTHGWAGGNWSGFNDWTFCPTRYFGRRDSRAYSLPGSQARQRWNLHEVPRGIIATDTRPITRDRWLKPTEVIEALERNGRDTRPGKPGETASLPDITGFVARQRELPPQVARSVVGRETEIGGTRNPRRDRETTLVDVNGEMEPRLPTNVLTPGHTSEDGKPPSPTGTSNPDFRLATPRQSSRTRDDVATPIGSAVDRKPAAPSTPTGEDWRNSGASQPRQPSGERRIAVPSSPRSTGTKPAGPVNQTPSARPVDRDATPSAAPEAWRDRGGVRSTAAPRRGTGSRESAPSAPVPSTSVRTAPKPTADDWRKPAAAPRPQPETSTRTPTTAPRERAEAKPESDDWRTEGRADAPPSPSAARVRVPNERSYATPAPSRTPDPADSPSVRRIMDGIGVGMGRPARTPSAPSTTPRPSASPSRSPYSTPSPAATAKPAERPSSPPPSTERRERSSARESGSSSNRGTARTTKDDDSEPPQ